MLSASTLLERLVKNICNKEEVTKKYGGLIKKMREYSFSKNIQNELATAFNAYGEYKTIEPKDFDNYYILHTEANLQSYKKKHNIDTFIFDIGVPKTKWTILREKIGLSNCDGLFLSGNFFKRFFHENLYFSIFGLAIENIESRDLLEHEALHVDIRFYSANFEKLINWRHIEYSKSELITKIEASLASELLCNLQCDKDKSETEKWLVTKYLPDYIDWAAYVNPKYKEGLKDIYEDIANRIHSVVEASYSLKSMLDYETTTTLFFSLGPTAEEIENKIFSHSPFFDICLWSAYLQKNIITKEQIDEKLKEKNMHHF